MQALGRRDDTRDPDAPTAPSAAGLVLRTHLFERLEQAPARALLWVSAAPGLRLPPPLAGLVPE